MKTMVKTLLRRAGKMEHPHGPAAGGGTNVLGHVPPFVLLLIAVLSFLPLLGISCASPSSRDDIVTYSFAFRNMDRFSSMPHDSMMPHPEYYLEKLRQAGVLRRGLTKQEVESWLGKPNQSTGKQDLWLYGMGYSGMYITFTNGLASEYHWWFEEGGPEGKTW